MFIEYIKIAIRQIFKEKAFSFVTIFGLAVGLTCVLNILLFVRDELSFDKYHVKADRIYRVIQGGDSEEQSSSLPFPTGPTLINDFPEFIEDYTRLFNFQASTLSIVYDEGSKHAAYNEPRFFFADSAYFRIFDHRFLSGNPARALNGPGLVVITESTAQRYFGTTDAVGKIIRFEGKFDLTVNGVIEDVPSNSHFKFDFIASFASLPALGFTIPDKNWYWNPVWTYVLLRENTQRSQVQIHLHDFVQKYYHPSLKDETELNLQPLENIYLYSRSEYEIGPMSDSRYIKVFSIVAFVILLIALINFVNLSTARATDRFKEVGVRKVTGASNRRLLFQYLTESVFISMLSLALACILTVGSIPLVNRLADKTFSIGEIFEPGVVLAGVGITLFTGLCAGIYPAVYLSSLNPSRVLKSGQSKASGSLLRKVLTMFQFGVSVVLMIMAFVIFRQTEFMKNSALGFEKEHVLVLPVQRLSIVPNYESFKKQILANSSVMSVSTTNTLLGKETQASNYKKKEEVDMSLYPCLFVRNDFTTTMGIKLLAGTDFSEDVTAPGYYAIINNSLCKKLGWQPADAIGKKIGGTLEGEITVTGVSEDFHYAPLKQAIGPMIMLRADLTKNRDFFTRFVMIRVQGGSVAESISFLRKAWNQRVPESPFDYFFLDEKLDTVYKQEDKVNKIVNVFSFVALFIACLGLYGLAVFSFRIRKKEVAVRKVMGASGSSIARLFAFDFMKLVVVGFAAGSALAIYVAGIWLEGFAYRVPVSPWLFVICLLLITAVALSTILVQTIRATLTNPVTVLRNE
ncbi:MAG TPA: FtsX-like permease family protein [Cyclobacteriaceae bacterium]|nr:FtsX-like permease family protein [Cyclobacteriaceae bacterium]